MPEVRHVLNGFTAHEVHRITGLSKPMIDYLARSDFLHPHYAKNARVRGKARYYSYRDLVVARLIQRLREGGVELRRLKDALQQLSRDDTWKAKRSGLGPIRWLVTDGKKVLLRDEDGFVDEFGPRGQRAFGFVVSLENMKKEVRAKIPPSKISEFSMSNRPLIYDNRIITGTKRLRVVGSPRNRRRARQGSA